MSKMLNILGCVGLGGAAFLASNEDAREKLMQMSGDALEKAKGLFDKKEVSVDADISDDAAATVDVSTEE